MIENIKKIKLIDIFLFSSVILFVFSIVYYEVYATNLTKQVSKTVDQIEGKNEIAKWDITQTIEKNSRNSN